LLRTDGTSWLTDQGNRVEEPTRSRGSGSWFHICKPGNLFHSNTRRGCSETNRQQALLCQPTVKMEVQHWPTAGTEERTGESSCQARHQGWEYQGRHSVQTFANRLNCYTATIVAAEQIRSASAFLPAFPG